MKTVLLNIVDINMGNILNYFRGKKTKKKKLKVLQPLKNNTT